jgi:hypothetical protein
LPDAASHAANCVGCQTRATALRGCLYCSLQTSGFYSWLSMTTQMQKQQMGAATGECESRLAVISCADVQTNSILVLQAMHSLPCFAKGWHPYCTVFMSWLKLASVSRDAGASWCMTLRKSCTSIMIRREAATIPLQGIWSSGLQGLLTPPCTPCGPLYPSKA